MFWVVDKDFVMELIYEEFIKLMHKYHLKLYHSVQDVKNGVHKASDTYCNELVT